MLFGDSQKIKGSPVVFNSFWGNLPSKVRWQFTHWLEPWENNPTWINNSVMVTSATRVALMKMLRLGICFATSSSHKFQRKERHPVRRNSKWTMRRCRGAPSSNRLQQFNNHAIFGIERGWYCIPWYQGSWIFPEPMRMNITALEHNFRSPSGSSCWGKGEEYVGKSLK